MELLGKHMAIARRLAPPTIIERGCVPFFAGESVHTMVINTEFDSLAALEASFEKMFPDPERQELMAKSDGCIVSHENEIYMPMP